MHMLHPLEELQAFSIVSHLASCPQISEGVPKARLMNFETTNERPDDGYIRDARYPGGGVVLLHRLLDFRAQGTIEALDTAELQDLPIEAETQLLAEYCRKPAAASRSSA